MHVDAVGGEWQTEKAWRKNRDREKVWAAEWMGFLFTFSLLDGCLGENCTCFHSYRKLYISLICGCSVFILCASWYNRKTNSLSLNISPLSAIEIWETWRRGKKKKKIETPYREMGSRGRSCRRKIYKTEQNKRRKCKNHSILNGKCGIIALERQNSKIWPYSDHFPPNRAAQLHSSG